MDNLSLINAVLLPILWKLVDKHQCSGNISKIGDLFQVSLVFSKKYRKHFVNADINALAQQLNNYGRN